MILAIIQARMGSTRLPGKSMMQLAGKPLIEHVVRRVQATETPMDVCVATTDQADDDVLAAHVEALPSPLCHVFRGSASDVLGRFYWASQQFPKAQVIVRITADDPFKDPKLIDYALTGFLGEWSAPQKQLAPPQYLWLGGLTWPTGCDVEVFTREALLLAHQQATSDFDREHVTSWMARTFNVWVLKNPYGLGDITTRWTIDTRDDLVFATHVYDQLYAQNPLFGFAELTSAGYHTHKGEPHAE